jgi:hypothetical protein
MFLRLGWCGSLVLVACSSSLTPGGGAGGQPGPTTGAGGQAGTGSGSAGAGGLATCPPRPPRAGIFGVGPGSPGPTSFAASATVVNAASCAIATCNGWSSDSIGYVLADGGGPMQTMIVLLPGAPIDLLKPGDSIDIRVDTSQTSNSVNTVTHRTTTVRRAGVLIMFDSDQVSDLAADGISGGATATALCRRDTCFVDHLANVTVGPVTLPLAPGDTGWVGPMTVTVNAADNPEGPCDSQPSFAIAGFRTP